MQSILRLLPACLCLFWIITGGGLPVAGFGAGIPADLQPGEMILRSAPQQEGNNVTAWRLCYRKPVNLSANVSDNAVIATEPRSEGPNYWLYELPVFEPGTLSVYGHEPAHWVSGCSFVQYGQHWYSIVERPEPFQSGDMPVAMPELIFRQSHQGAGITRFQPAERQPNHERYVRQINQIDCPNLNNNTGNMASDDSAAPMWVALLGIMTWVLFTCAGCCTGCLCHKNIHQCIHCQPGK